MIVLDSDLLIDLLRRDAQTLAFLERLSEEGETLGTTSLNVAEILRGAHRDRESLATAVKILAALHEVPFGPRAARRFGQVMNALDKAGRSIPALDGMIAAAALEEGGRIATRNARHFARVGSLEVLEP